MFAHRVAIVLAGGTALGLALLPSTVAAQVPDGVALNIMRECSRIDDPSARLACYDNNIRSAGGAQRNTVPGQVQVQGGGGAVVTDGRPTGFGREDLPVPETVRQTETGPSEISATVAEVSMRTPGVYLFTLQDGAQWIFAENAGSNYDPPRRGSRLDIRRGALDSFLMRYNNQAPVRVRRIR